MIDEFTSSHIVYITLNKAWLTISWIDERFNNESICGDIRIHDGEKHY